MTERPESSKPRRPRPTTSGNDLILIELLKTWVTSTVIVFESKNRKNLCYKCEDMFVFKPIFGIHSCAKVEYLNLRDF